MKKIFLTLIMTAALALGVDAQQQYGYYQDQTTQYSDGFFSSQSESGYQYRNIDNMPIVPGTGYYYDQQAPLGSGLLLLAGLGAAYAVRKRKKDNE